MVNLRPFFILREVFMSDVAVSPRSPLARLVAVVRLVNGYVLTVLAFALVVCVVWQVLSRYTQVWANKMPLEFLADLLRLIKPSTVTDELARFMFMGSGCSAPRRHLPRSSNPAHAALPRWPQVDQPAMTAPNLSLHLHPPA